MKKKAKKNKLIILILILVITIIIILSFAYVKSSNIKKENARIKKENHIKEINSYYNDFVTTNKETKLYNSDNEEVGTISNNVELTLLKETISENTKYFKIKTFDNDYYIKYQDVDKIDKLSETNERYKKYIVFNENIITNDKTSFYDENDKLLYTLNKSFDFPIIIKEDYKYVI